MEKQKTKTEKEIATNIFNDFENNNGSYYQLSLEELEKNIKKWSDIVILWKNWIIYFQVLENPKIDNFNEIYSFIWKFVLKTNNDKKLIEVNDAELLIKNWFFYFSWYVKVYDWNSYPTVNNQPIPINFKSSSFKIFSKKSILQKTKDWFLDKFRKLVKI